VAGGAKLSHASGVEARERYGLHFVDLNTLLDQPWVFDEDARRQLNAWEEGVIIADATGELVYANPPAMAMHGTVRLGAVPDDYSLLHGLFTVEGRPFPSPDLPLVRAVRHGETVLESRWRIRRPDGSVLAATGSAYPLHDEDGNRVGGILLCIPMDPA